MFEDELAETYRKCHRLYSVSRGKKKKELRGRLLQLREIRKDFDARFLLYTPPKWWRRHFERYWICLCAKWGERRLSKEDTLSDLAAHCTPRENGQGKRKGFKSGRG